MIDSCNGAVLEGYTEEILAVIEGRETCLMVKPNTNFAESFKAFDTDLMEMIHVDVTKGFWRLIPVQKLWEANKHGCWEVGEATITLEEFLAEKFDEIDGTDDEAWLEVHCNSIGYWEEQLKLYKGREKEIPENWAMQVCDMEDGINVEDGNHRLVAAMLVGLETYPCKEFIP